MIRHPNEYRQDRPVIEFLRSLSIPEEHIQRLRDEVGHGRMVPWFSSFKGEIEASGGGIAEVREALTRLMPPIPPEDRRDRPVLELLKGLGIPEEHIQRLRGGVGRGNMASWFSSFKKGIEASGGSMAEVKEALMQLMPSAAPTEKQPAAAEKPPTVAEKLPIAEGQSVASAYHQPSFSVKAREWAISIASKPVNLEMGERELQYRLALLRDVLATYGQSNTPEMRALNKQYEQLTHRVDVLRRSALRLYKGSAGGGVSTEAGVQRGDIRTAAYKAVLGRLREARREQARVERQMQPQYERQAEIRDVQIRLERSIQEHVLALAAKGATETRGLEIMGQPVVSESGTYMRDPGPAMPIGKGETPLTPAGQLEKARYEASFIEQMAEIEHAEGPSLIARPQRDPRTREDVFTEIRPMPWHERRELPEMYSTGWSAEKAILEANRGTDVERGVQLLQAVARQEGMERRLSYLTRRADRLAARYPQPRPGVVPSLRHELGLKRVAEAQKQVQKLRAEIQRNQENIEKLSALRTESGRPLGRQLLEEHPGGQLAYEVEQALEMAQSRTAWLPAEENVPELGRFVLGPEEQRVLESQAPPGEVLKEITTPGPGWQPGTQEAITQTYQEAIESTLGGQEAQLLARAFRSGNLEPQAIFMGMREGGGGTLGDLYRQRAALAQVIQNWRRRVARGTHTQEQFEATGLGAKFQALTEQYQAQARLLANAPELARVAWRYAGAVYAKEPKKIEAMKELLSTPEGIATVQAWGLAHPERKVPADIPQKASRKIPPDAQQIAESAVASPMIGEFIRDIGPFKKGQRVPLVGESTSGKSWKLPKGLVKGIPDIAKSFVRVIPVEQLRKETLLGGVLPSWNPAQPGEWPLEAKGETGWKIGETGVPAAEIPAQETPSVASAPDVARTPPEGPEEAGLIDFWPPLAGVPIPPYLISGSQIPREQKEWLAGRGFPGYVPSGRDPYEMLRKGQTPLAREYWRRFHGITDVPGTPPKTPPPPPQVPLPPEEPGEMLGGRPGVGGSFGPPGARRPVGIPIGGRDYNRELVRQGALAGIATGLDPTTQKIYEQRGIGRLTELHERRVEGPMGSVALRVYGATQTAEQLTRIREAQERAVAPQSAEKWAEQAEQFIGPGYKLRLALTGSTRDLESFRSALKETIKAQKDYSSLLGKELDAIQGLSSRAFEALKDSIAEEVGKLGQQVAAGVLKPEEAERMEWQLYAGAAQVYRRYGTRAEEIREQQRELERSTAGLQDVLARLPGGREPGGLTRTVERLGWTMFNLRRVYGMTFGQIGGYLGAYALEEAQMKRLMASLGYEPGLAGAGQSISGFQAQMANIQAGLGKTAWGVLRPFVGEKGPGTEWTGGPLGYGVLGTMGAAGGLGTAALLAAAFGVTLPISLPVGIALASLPLLTAGAISAGQWANQQMFGPQSEYERYLQYKLGPGAGGIAFGATRALPGGAWLGEQVSRAFKPQEWEQAQRATPARLDETVRQWHRVFEAMEDLVETLQKQEGPGGIWTLGGGIVKWGAGIGKQIVGQPLTEQEREFAIKQESITKFAEAVGEQVDMARTEVYPLLTEWMARRGITEVGLPAQEAAFVRYLNTARISGGRDTAYGTSIAQAMGYIPGTQAFGWAEDYFAQLPAAQQEFISAAMQTSYGQRAILGLPQAIEWETGLPVYTTFMRQAEAARRSGGLVTRPALAGERPAAEELKVLEVPRQFSEFGRRQEALAREYSQLRENWGYQNRMWDIEARRLALTRSWKDEDYRREREQQWQRIQWQQEDIAYSIQSAQLSHQHFQENMELQRRYWQNQMRWREEDMQVAHVRRQQQIKWNYEDIAFNRHMAELRFGWQQEDYDRAIRFATGRQKVELMRERERAVIIYNLERERESTALERLKTQEQWAERDYAKALRRLGVEKALDTERFELEIRHENQRFQLTMSHLAAQAARAQEMARWAMEDLDRQEARRKELEKLEDEAIAAQKQHATWVHNNQAAYIAQEQDYLAWWEDWELEITRVVQDREDILNNLNKTFVQKFKAAWDDARTYAWDWPIRFTVEQSGGWQPGQPPPQDPKDTGPTPAPPTPTVYSCPFCGRQFSNQADRDAHIAARHSEVAGGIGGAVSGGYGAVFAAGAITVQVYGVTTADELVANAGPRLAAFIDSYMRAQESI